MQGQVRPYPATPTTTDNVKADLASPLAVNLTVNLVAQVRPPISWLKEQQYRCGIDLPYKREEFLTSRGLLAHMLEA